VWHNHKDGRIQTSIDLFGGRKMEQNTELKSNLNMMKHYSNNFKGKLAVRETAQYISDMMLELRNMAKSAELKTLQGLLEVSFYEAFSVANKVDIPGGEIEKLRELSTASNG
jgi:hypothetical protein